MLHEADIEDRFRKLDRSIATLRMRGYGDLDLQVASPVSRPSPGEDGLQGRGLSYLLSFSEPSISVRLPCLPFLLKNKTSAENVNKRDNMGIKSLLEWPMSPRGGRWQGLPSNSARSAAGTNDFSAPLIQCLQLYL